MQLNESFVTNINSVYGEAGINWLKNIEQQITQLATLWNFNFLFPFPNLTYNFVGLVALDDQNKTAILKMVPEKNNFATEVHWLNCFDQGVPKILQQSEMDNAFLMEHLKPGQTLKNLVKSGNDDEATRLICDVIKQLQQNQHSNFRFPHLSELSSTLSLLKNHFDDKLFSKAEFLFDELTQDRSNDVVLHGDLHHDNIISSGATWKAIDPHGYIGDPVAEVGAMIRNPFDHFPIYLTLDKIIARRLQIIRDELAFDAQKIKAWAFCMTVLSAAWRFEDHGKISDFEMDVIRAIDKMKF